jgi:hypothetical protein
MRRFTILAAMVCALVLATTSWAQSPHYITLNEGINCTTNCYDVFLKEAGLGGADTITYTLTANATFQAQCFTRSGKPVNGTVKQGSGTASSQTTLDVRNGQTTGTISLCPAAFDLPDPGCTGSQHIEIITASYTNVVLDDGAGNADAENLSDQSCP